MRLGNSRPVRDALGWRDLGDDLWPNMADGVAGGSFADAPLGKRGRKILSAAKAGADRPDRLASEIRGEDGLCMGVAVRAHSLTPMASRQQERLNASGAYSPVSHRVRERRSIPRRAASR